MSIPRQDVPTDPMLILTIKAFGGLVEHCFMSCVDDFTSKAISNRESGCINRCVQKWMASQQRISDRFQEHNAQLTAQMNK